MLVEVVALYYIQHEEVGKVMTLKYCIFGEDGVVAVTVVAVAVVVIHYMLYEKVEKVMMLKEHWIFEEGIMVVVHYLF